MNNFGTIPKNNIIFISYFWGWGVYVHVHVHGRGGEGKGLKFGFFYVFFMFCFNVKWHQFGDRATKPSYEDPSITKVKRNIRCFICLFNNFK